MMVHAKYTFFTPIFINYFMLNFLYVIVFEFWVQINNKV